MGGIAAYIPVILRGVRGQKTYLFITKADIEGLE